MSNKFAAHNHKNPVIPQAVSCPPVRATCITTPCNQDVYLPNRLNVFVHSQGDNEGIIRNQELTWHVDVTDWRTVDRFDLGCDRTMAVIVYCVPGDPMGHWELGYNSTWPGDYEQFLEPWLIESNPWSLYFTGEQFFSDIDLNCEAAMATMWWDFAVTIPQKLQHIPCGSFLVQE